MGGIGRTQDIEKTRTKEPSKKHRAKNVKSKDPDFKIGNQKQLSQSFAADLLPEEKEKGQAANRILANQQRAGVHKKIQRIQSKGANS